MIIGLNVFVFLLSVRDMVDFEKDKKYKGYMLIYVLINGIIIYMLVIKILIIVFFKIY